MRPLVPCRHHPRGCSHGRPSGSYRRYGSEDHRSTSPTQPLGSWLDGLPNPEPDLDSILVLKNATAQPACSSLHLSTEEAFGRAYQAIEHYQRTKVACLAPGKRNMYPTQNLPFMVFDQLDREMFRSVLKGNVHLTWSVPLPSGIYATTRKADPIKWPRITIMLSKSLSEAPRSEVLRTLVHQMMHAYFLQCCGYQTQGGGSDGHDLCHGPEFRALLLTIGRRCYLNGHQSTFAFSNPLPIRPGSRRLLRRPGPRRKSWSNCYTSVSPMRGVDRIDDKNWRDMAIAKVRSLDEEIQTLRTQQPDISRVLEFLIPFRDGVPPTKLDFPIPAKPRSPQPSEPDFYFIDPATSIVSSPMPRSQYPLAPESYIELRFGSHAFPLERDHIAPHLPWLAKSPCFFNKRILVLPPWSDSTNVVILHTFLHYTPYSSSTATPSDPVQFPIIGTYKLNSSATVKSQISVYYLALALQCIPLASYAIDTLKTLRYTHENPIAVLESIYHPPESVPQIPGFRDWTKSWLALRIPHADGWEDYAAKYPTNLSVVKDHPDWQAAYVTLREKGTVLVTDLDAVEAEIAKPQALTSTYQQEQPRLSSHDFLLSVLPPTNQETYHRPISRQDPSSTPIPFHFPALPSALNPAPAYYWHELPASKDIQEENWRKMRDEDEAQKKRQEEEEKRRKRKEEEGRKKRKEEEERKRKEEEQKATQNDIIRIMQMWRDGDFPFGEK